MRPKRFTRAQHMTDDNIRLAVVSKLSWIKKQQAGFRAQPRQSRRAFVAGESHYLFGRRYRLDVVERYGRHEISIKNNTRLQLVVSPGTTLENREKVLNQWYRVQLKERIPALIARWEPVVGVRVAHWGVKKMKTKWGSCNIKQRRIWLNLELAKKSQECLEYVIVHEMVHLLERHHNDTFKRYMDRCMPRWWMYRQLLNGAPLGHEDWEY